MNSSAHRIRAAALLAPLALLTACGGGSGSKAVATSGEPAASAAATSAAVTSAATASAVGTSAAASAPSAPASASSAAAAAAGSTSAAASGAAAAQNTAPVTAGKQPQVRFANFFFTAAGKPGPALDIYDTQEGQAAKPLLAAVTYGSVSSFVVPTLSNGTAEFYALPAGEDPVKNQTDAKGLDGLQDDGSHPSETLILSGDKGTIEQGPLGGLASGIIVEKGDDNGYKGPDAPPPPAGHGEILVDTSAFSDLVSNTGNFLLIDASCDPPLNGDHTRQVPAITPVDGEAPVSDFAVFATTPGTHRVSVVIQTSDVDVACAKLAPKQGTVAVTLAAGQQVEAYVYGTSPTDAHIALAPIPQ